MSPTPFDPDSVMAATFAHAMSPTPFDPDALMAAAAAIQAAPSAPPPPRGLAAPLNKLDKWRLADIAANTYRTLKAAGQIQPGETLEQFRRRVAIAACGRRISQATLADKGPIQSAFLTLKGDTQAAARATAKALGTDVQIALNALRRNLRQRHLTTAYAESIAMRFFKRPVRDLSAKEIWNVIFTVRNNHKAVKA